MIYYIWMSYLISQFESWDQRIIYFVFNNILTSIVFVEIILAHVAMPTDPFTDQEEFALHPFWFSCEESSKQPIL